MFTYKKESTVITYEHLHMFNPISKLFYSANIFFGMHIIHVKLRTHPARNSQLLGQIDVGTVCILFDRPICLPESGTCTTNICTVQLEMKRILYMEPGPAQAEIVYFVIYKLAQFHREINVIICLKMDTYLSKIRQTYRLTEEDILMII